MMYPITFIPLWATIVGVIVAVVLSYWVADEDDSARPLGLGAVFISLVTASCWMTGLPGWTAAAVIIATLGLFITGMLVSESVDDLFHYGALVVAVFGKLLMGLVPLIWSILTGQSTVPNMVLALLIVFVALAYWAGRAGRARRLVGRLNPAT